MIRLKRLSDDELFALISRITKLYAVNYGATPRITEGEMVNFLEISLSRAGADQLITPREMLRDYMTVLNILMQNEDATFDEIVNASAEPKSDDTKPEKDECKGQGGYSAADIEF